MSQQQQQQQQHRITRSILRTSRTHRLMRARLPILGAAAVAALGVSGIAMGQAVSWVGPVAVPAPFEVGANWSGGSVPGGSDLAFVDNGGIANVSTFSGSMLTLAVGNGTSTSGTIIQDGGSITTDAGVVVAGHITATGTYTLNNGALSSNDFFIGSKGNGTLNMNGGTITSLSNMRLGDDNGSNGVLNMTGGVVTLPSFLLVGHFSPTGSGTVTTGTYNMSGGTLTVANFNVGQHPNARGEVHQTGGFINNTANLVVAEISRQENLYDLSGGTLRIVNTNNNGSAFIGSSQGIGTLRVSGTGNAQIDGHIFLAGGTTAFGTFNMSGGTVALGLNKPEGGFLVVGENGQATATISGGNFASDFLQLGRRANATSRGQLMQTGGDITVRRSMNIGGLSGNDNYYHITGGSLNLTDNLGGGTLNETASGIHVARFSVNPGTFTPVTQYSAGRLTVDGTAVVNIAGGLHNSTGFTGVINLDGGGTQSVQLPGGQGIIEMKGGSLTAGSFLNGGVANAGSFNNGGATANYMQTGGVATLGHVTGTGQVAVSGGTMNVNSLSQAAATVSGSGTVRVAPNGTSTATSRLNSLSVGDSGQFDLANNALVVDYASGGPSPLADIRADIISGYAGGAWNGPGINSSTAAGGSTHAIGYSEASDLTSVPPIFGTVDADAVLAVYTRYGDANLDLTVNLADFNRLASNFGTPAGANWSQGDFTFDGIVNLQDFNRLAANFGMSAGPDGVVDPEDWAALAAVIPEPSAALSMVFAGALLLRRRRQRGIAR
jgi:hypothetical protein